MIFRPTQVFLFCLLAITSESGGKTQNSSPKPVDKLNPHAGQNFVVNNNCGLAKTEREMMAHIKAKVDYIAAQSGKGEVFTLCRWIAHTTGNFGPISVTERSRAAPISKVGRHLSDRFCATLWKCSVNNYSDYKRYFVYTFFRIKICISLSDDANKIKTLNTERV